MLWISLLVANALAQSELWQIPPEYAHVHVRTVALHEVKHALIR